ncbi:MAG: G5 domain-containing protein, partial [Staphylococcus sp.]|nr:G5 domain-containing protein [Staphylococcus sp.]
LANENNSSVKYTYLAENELTEAEKSLIKRSIPENVKNNETYYMVYKKEAKPSSEIKSLPNTGQSSLPVAGLGIGTAVLVVLLMSKKHRNKVLSVVLIGAMGQSMVMPYQSFAFENKELVRYNTQTTVANSSELANGVINIDGYRYVGYFTLSDLSVSPQGEQKVLPKQTQPIVEPTQPQPEPTPAPKTLVENKPELKSTTEAVPFKTVEQPDATLPKGQTKVVQEGINGEQIVFSEVTTVDGKSASKVIKSTITKQPVDKIIAVGTKEAVRPQPIEVNPNKPEAPKPVAVKGTQETGKEGQSLTQPELPVAPKSEETRPTPQPETPKPEETKPTPQPETPKPEETKPTPQPEKPEEKVDKTALKAQIDRALALVPADYSAASYDALKPILAAAQNVYASDSVKQPEVDSETAKLKAAIDALSVDKTDLNKTIADAKSKTKEHYSDASWANLQNVLAEAEKVTNNPAAKQSEVDHINEKLKAAIAGLNTDKTELEKQLADANSKTASDFSPETWSALEEAKK